MHFIRILLFIAMVAMAAGCAPAATAEPTVTLAPPTATQTALPSATFTPAPPTATETPLPTDTPRPTATPAPTDTPEPSDTPTATVDPCEGMPGTQSRQVRLTVVNQTGQDIFMKLEACGVSGTYYYFMIPAGSADSPTVKVFTVNPGGYRRTTISCGEKEAKVSGLEITGNVKITMTSCVTPTPTP